MNGMGKIGTGLHYTRIKNKEAPNEDKLSATLSTLLFSYIHCLGNVIHLTAVQIEKRLNQIPIQKTYCSLGSEAITPITPLMVPNITVGIWPTSESGKHITREPCRKRLTNSPRPTLLSGKAAELKGHMHNTVTVHGNTSYYNRKVAIMGCNYVSIEPLLTKVIRIHTVKNSGVDASTEPPNQTANLWIGWLSTLTSTGCD
ncbi:hypothetical protein Lal_00024062 [Lupinus albus]|nr:hypothetical protein Lal_00024062 [Lupinus albus]